MNLPNDCVTGLGGLYKRSEPLTKEYQFPLYGVKGYGDW